MDSGVREQKIKSLISAFWNDFTKSVIENDALNQADRISICETLLEAQQLTFGESPDYAQFEMIIREKMVKPLGRKVEGLLKAGLTHYFIIDSKAYRKIYNDDSFYADCADPELPRHYDFDRVQTTIRQLISASLQKMFLAEGSEDLTDEEPLSDTANEFTLRRQVLVMYYIDKAYQLSSGADRTNLARLVELLTGKNYKNIYDYVRNPFPNKTGNRIVNDLKYIREYFVKLRNEQIIALIDKDIQVYR